MKAGKPQVCIISAEVVGPHKNGGVGTHCYYLSAFLSRNLKQEVTFLYTGKIEARDEGYWKQWFRQHLDIEFVWLAPPETTGPAPPGLWCYHDNIARRTFEWLRQRNFDVCHFQDMLGNGFRCFQAKRLGLALRQTVLTCTVHGPWDWVCEAMEAFPQCGLEELQTKFLERYSIETCDVLISPSNYMLQWLAENRIAPPPRKHLLPYLFDPKLHSVGYRKPANQVIFFGRLEARKGLLLFLETLLDMDRQQAFAQSGLYITFLGRSGDTPDGGGVASIRKFAARFSSALKVREITDFGQPEALKFLSRHNDALVVCPSLIDNSPYAVIELLQLGLNIIAANSGGIPELFAGEERLFEPEPKALAAKIRAGLNNELPPPAKRYDLAASTRMWEAFCRETLPALQFPIREARRAAPPSIGVFLGLAKEKPAALRTLEAIAAQTFRDFSVTVLTPPDNQNPLAEEAQEYCHRRSWPIVESRSSDPLPVSGPGQDYVVFLSPGGVPRPRLLAQMVESLEWSGLDALTCFSEIVDEQNPRGSFVYQPLGACLEGGLFNNFLGAGCVIMRRECAQRLRSVGPRLHRPQGLWGFLAEISAAGQAWDVIPEPLASMERNAASLCCADLDYPNHIEVLDAFSLGLPLWLRHVLVNAAGSERKLVAAERQLFEKQQAYHALSLTLT